MSPKEQIESLYRRAREAPDTPMAVTLIEEAVRLSDSHLDVKYQFATRLDLVAACFAAGKPRRLFVALSWCLSAIDRSTYSPDADELDRLLWICKHAVSYSPSFASISYPQFGALVEDTVNRYEAAGASPRSVYMLAGYGESWMGHHANGREKVSRGKKLPRDRFSESDPWELFFDVALLLVEHRTEDALKLSEPMLAEPERSMGVDAWFVSPLLMTLVDAGRTEEAMRHHNRVVSRIAGNSKFTSMVGMNFGFLAFINELPAAQRLFQENIDIGLTAGDEASRFNFSLYAQVLLSRLIHAGIGNIRLHVPDGVPSFPESDDGAFSTKILMDWFETERTRLCEQLNQRNGNQYLDSVVEQVLTRIDW